jgi:type IX secretion system PorP/SprF family membrane protein
MRTLIIILLLLSCFSPALRAQDPTFSQFSTIPLYYNPAFAGSAEKPRLTAIARDQWQGRYMTGYLSYDQAVRALHGGIGLSVLDDYSGHSRNEFYTGLSYAPKFTLSKKIGVSPGLTVGYMHTTINMQYLTAPNGSVYHDPGIVPKQDNFDLSAGLLINTKKFYAGFAANHFLPGDKHILPVKYVVQSGYTFQKSDESDFSASIGVIYQVQNPFSYFQTNISFRYKWIMAGVGSSGNTRLTGMLGYYSKRFIVGYSYEYFSPVVASYFGGAHELSARYFMIRKKAAKNHED